MLFHFDIIFQTCLCFGLSEKQHVDFLKYCRPELFVFWANGEKHCVVYSFIFRSCLFSCVNGEATCCLLEISSSGVVCLFVFMEKQRGYVAI